MDHYEPPGLSRRESDDAIKNAEDEMTKRAEEILKQALELPPADRLTVAQELWDSVDPYPDAPIVIDDALMAEIDRRDEELRSGAVKPLTHEELMQSIQGSLERGRAATLEIDEEFAEELRRRDAEMDAGMVMTREEMHAAIQQKPAALQRTRTDIRNWQLWQPGPIEGQVGGISPLLASWEKSSHPAQVRLRAYLDDLANKLLPLPENEPLFLRLDVDVEEPERLLHHYDLENYLTPLFGSRSLPSSQFVLVMARKYVGGGSRITWGKATHATLNDNDEWSCFTLNAGPGATQKSWKERIRAALSDSNPAVVAPGPARVRVAWRCTSHRNWCTFWKPTGDAMGPVLGVSNPLKPYHLDDDRIVDLEFHRNVDDALGNDVEVGMWWSAAKPSSPKSPVLEFGSDEQYLYWREHHPQGYVLNSRRPPSPAYMVLHRASCRFISEPLHEKMPGGFTERQYFKVGADDVESLRNWVSEHGRPDRTFSNECDVCRPTVNDGGASR